MQRIHPHRSRLSMVRAVELVAQVNHMPGTDFFAYAAELMRVHPPHPTDWSILQRMRRIGLEPGKSFKTQTLENGVKQALLRARLPRRRFAGRGRWCRSLGRSRCGRRRGFGNGAVLFVRH